MKKLLTLMIIGLSLGLSAGELKWETDFEKAKTQAAREDKPILINFTGSDWCGWCKRLDREVFSKDSFAEFANQSMVLLKVDFPRFSDLPEEQLKRNEELAEKYQVLGFPAIYLVDASGAIKLKTGYRRGGAESYIQHLKEKF